MNGNQGRLNAESNGYDLTNSARFNTPALEQPKATLTSKSGRKADRYAQDGNDENSKVADEDLKFMVNSPPTAKTKALQLQTFQTEDPSMTRGQQSPNFGGDDDDLRKPKANQLDIPFSKKSQEDIANRKTFNQIEEDPARAANNSSMMSIGNVNVKSETQAGKTTQNDEKSAFAPQMLDTGPPANAMNREAERQQKLETMKEYAKFKKVVEYQSETIELYEMISEEFDYEELRKNSHLFNIKQYKDSIYRGEINKKRKREGKGVIVYEAGRIYEGTWAADKRSGRGYELFSNGNTYQGAYEGGKAHGKGTYSWRNGEVYDGEWQKGQKQGYGVWNGIQGDSYIGQWVDSKAEGYGVHTWVDGDRYEGEWKKCLRNGNGTDFFANGDLYVGQYQEGRPHGFGQYKWANGNSYTGDFHLGQKHGKGKWKKAPSDISNKNNFNQFEGHYEMDKKHGFGEFIWESGNKYEGNYHTDERQGYGTMTWTDESKYVGHWVKGVQHGVGQMSFPDGSTRAGFFENNIFQLPLTQRKQLKGLDDQMPEDVLKTLTEFLNDREQKQKQMRDEGFDIQSDAMLESEQNFMGREFKPRVEMDEPSEDERYAKMATLKGMNEIGKEINPAQQNQAFVNHEGLKRVYKPKAQREQEQVQQQQQQQTQLQNQNPNLHINQQDAELIPEQKVEKFQMPQASYFQAPQQQLPPVQMPKQSQQNLQNNPIAQQYLSQGGQLGQPEQPSANMYQQPPQMDQKTLMNQQMPQMTQLQQQQYQTSKSPQYQQQSHLIQSPAPSPSQVEHEQRLKAVEERLMKVEFQTGEQREQQQQDQQQRVYDNNKRIQQFQGSNAHFAQLQDLNVRRTSVVKNTETQTEMRMEELQQQRLNHYELSAKTDKTDKTKPSDPHGSSSNYNTYKENSIGTGDRDKSDFGQMFRASVEFPLSSTKAKSNSKRKSERGGIDESITFTEQIQKSRTGIRVVSTDAPARQTYKVESDDEQKKKNIPQKNQGTNTSRKKNKMIQTTQAGLKKSRFLEGTDDGTYVVSDEGPPIKIKNEKKEHSAKKPPRHDVKREKQTEADTQYLNQESSQSRTQRMNNSLMNTTPNQNDSDSDVIRSKKQNSKRRTPKYQERSEHESDVTENKLPSIKDKDQITTGGFKKKFQKEAQIKISRHNFLQENLSEADEYSDSLSVHSTLRFHEFEVLPMLENKKQESDRKLPNFEQHLPYSVQGRNGGNFLSERDSIHQNNAKFLSQNPTHMNQTLQPNNFSPGYSPQHQSQNFNSVLEYYPPNNQLLEIPQILKKKKIKKVVRRRGASIFNKKPAKMHNLSPIRITSDTRRAGVNISAPIQLGPISLRNKDNAKLAAIYKAPIIKNQVNSNLSVNVKRNIQRKNAVSHLQNSNLSGINPNLQSMSTNDASNALNFQMQSYLPNQNKATAHFTNSSHFNSFAQGPALVGLGGGK